MSPFSIIEHGGVTSPQGFAAAGVAAGLKQSGKPDCALLVSQCPALASAAFTANRFQAAPVVHGRRLLAENRRLRAVFVNSGNANACTGEVGLRDAQATAVAVAARLGLAVNQVLIGSTGRIGVPLPMDKIMRGIELAAAALDRAGGAAAAAAIMTTDTRPKAAAATLAIDGTTVTIGGMAKGAGMIAPKLVGPKNQATMLAYVTTDARISQGFLDDCLEQALDLSFNRITVDGDTSTNDTFLVLANGLAANRELDANHPQANAFIAAFNWLVGHLAREMVLDGEGVTKFVELRVYGAATDSEARACAEAIANSALCKTAWFGGDPNWGRILAAAGYSGARLQSDRVNLDYQGLPVVRGGLDAGTPVSEQERAVAARELKIELDLGVGEGEFTVWTCDLSYEYVKINADYRT